MVPAGFCHFSALAPHHLALVEPGGRHWSRGELCLEITRLSNGLAKLPVTSDTTLAIALDNRAEAISLALAAQKLQCTLLVLTEQQSLEQSLAQAQAAGATLLVYAGQDNSDEVMAVNPLDAASPRPYSALLAAPDPLPPSANDTDPMSGITQARQLMAALEIQPDDDQVHYCGTALSVDDALPRALAFLHFGHPVVLEEHWSISQMLHHMEQYRVTSCQLNREQAIAILDSPPLSQRDQELESVRFLFAGDESSDSRLRRSLQEWWGKPLQVHPALPSGPGSLADSA